MFKNIKNKIEKLSRDFLIEFRVQDLRMKDINQGIDVLTERLVALEKYLGIVFTNEETPRKVVREYRKSKKTK